MTVQAFRIQNFMAFEDTGWIEFRPITLLFGRNSSGKSALIRAWRLLKQSLYALPDEGPLVFVAEEGLDQGSFLETVHNQRVDEPMVFHFRCQLGKSLDGLIEVINRRSQRLGLSATANTEEQGQNDWVDLSLGFRWDGHKPFLSLVRIDCPCAASHQESIFAAEKLYDKKWITSGLLGKQAMPHDLALWRQVILSLSVGFLPAPAGQVINQDELVAAEEFLLVQRLMDDLRESVSEFLKSMEYLGPIRPEPQRVYTLEPLLRQRLRQRGLSAWLDFLLDQADDEQLKEIDQWLQRLGLGEEVAKQKDKYSSGAVTISEVAIHEVQKSKAINLKDMGFGASQVLPIIVHGVLAHAGSFTMIEQPELHLHPAAQATLADFFIHQANCGKRFLLETHSEHLLLRFQRRIAETSYDAIRPDKDAKQRNNGYSLKNPDFELVFVTRADTLSTVELIFVDQRGQIVEQSIEFRDFFSNDYEDIMQLTRTTAEIIHLGHQNDRRD